MPLVITNYPKSERGVRPWNSVGGFHKLDKKAKEGFCRNAKELLCVSLHWHVPFIEDPSETVPVIW